MSSSLTPELLGQLLDDLGGTLALYAARWTSQADDCVQEAFVELARQANLPDQPAAWLFRVVKHKALSDLRRKQRRERHEQAAAERWLQHRDTAEQSRELTEAIDELPDDLREVLIARTWGGLNFEELGTLIGVSTATAHRKYELALATLRTLWEGVCPPRTST